MIGQPIEAHDLSQHGSLLVRRVVLRDDWMADALLDLAAGDQKEWDLQEWDTLLTELENSSLTVEEWLTLYT